MSIGWELFIIWEIFLLVWAICALIYCQKNERVKIFFQILGFVVLIPIFSLGVELEKSQLQINTLPNYLPTVIIGFIITLLGLVFAIWSRIKLGKHWSGEVKILPNQKLIRDGPYKIVRHPIYTGMIIGMLGTAIILVDIIGGVLFITSIFALTKKSREEEKLLLEHFSLQYEQYKKDVKMLIPFLL